LAIVFFMPLCFAVFFKTNDAFELNKMVLFKILTLSMLFFVLFKLILNFNIKEAAARLKNLIFGKRYLIIPFFFLLSLATAAIFSKNISLSYYGLYERHQGLESHIYYLLFFVLLLAVLKNKHQIDRIVITAVLSSFFVSLYGIIQIAGFDFMEWMEPAILTGRVSSTLGQPNFLASYLLLVIPMAGYLFFASKKFLIKFFWLIIALFQLLCLLFTYSRAGWVGLVFGLAAAILIYFLIAKKAVDFSQFLFKNHKKIIIYFSLFVIFGIGALLINNNSFFAVRVTSMIDPASGSNAARINFWKASADAIKKAPMLGYGPDSQGEVFVRYYKKDWAINGKVNVYPNRAHNLFLDVILTSGFVGLIFYLALLYLFFKLIIDNIKNSKSKFLSWLILFAVIGYLISLMFGFAVTATNVYFWLYFAIIIAINSEQEAIVSEKKDEERLRDQKNKYCLLIKLLKFVLIITIGAGIFFQISKEFKKLIADHYFMELRLSYINQEYFKAFTLYDYIKKTKIKQDYYDRNFGIMLADQISGFNALALTITGERVLENIVENLSGNSYADIFARAKIYAALASEEKQSYYDLAKDNFSQVIGLSPQMPKNYREPAKMYFKKGDYEIAISNYKKALTMVPEISESMSKMHKWFAEHEKYLIYKDLGEIYSKQGLYEEAKYYYWLAYENNMPDITMFRKIADTYYLRGDLSQAIWYNKRGYMLNPQDYAWPFAIALLYQEQGDKDNALIYAEKALELAPEDEQAKEFIKNLK